MELNAAVDKSPYRSLTPEMANGKRTLVLWPVLRKRQVNHSCRLSFWCLRTVLIRLFLDVRGDRRIVSFYRNVNFGILLEMYFCTMDTMEEQTISE